MAKFIFEDHLSLAPKSATQLDEWLTKNHASETELWVQMYKKATGIPTITWPELVTTCLAWGWIDGQKRSLNDQSYILRITPRRKGSNWSKINVNHVQKLIEQNKMQPSGMVHVEAAKADGRWENAYLPPSEMVIPDDFLTALDKSPNAKITFDALNRSSLFAIYAGLQTAKKPETREKRKLKFIAKLENGQTSFP